jgi:hypothetical protein
MKVGDLVKHESVPHEFAEVEEQIGVVMQLSRTGVSTVSAKVFFGEGDEAWYDTGILEVVSEGR